MEKLAEKIFQHYKAGIEKLAGKKVSDVDVIVYLINSTKDTFIGEETIEEIRKSLEPK